MNLTERALRALGRASDRLWLKRAFSVIDQEQVASACAHAEQMTSAEIRVAIRSRREHGVLRLVDQAVRDFKREGMEQTRDGTGVLILISLQDRALYIIADMPIGQKLGHQFWVKHTRILDKKFGTAGFTDAVCDLVHEIGSMLHHDFPRKQDDQNEIPDHPIFLTGSEHRVYGSEHSWQLS